MHLCRGTLIDTYLRVLHIFKYSYILLISSYACKTLVKRKRSFKKENILLKNVPSCVASPAAMFFFYNLTWHGLNRLTASVYLTLVLYGPISFNSHRTVEAALCGCMRFTLSKAFLTWRCFN